MSEQTPATDAGGVAGGSTQGAADAAPGLGENPRVVGLDSADAADVIDAVGSDTARGILEAVHDDRGTASGLADRVDISLQTVQYHLGNLTEAGLIEVVGSTTSEKGREMDVYGPARQPVVVYAGDEDGTDLRSMLGRLVSAVGFLAVASLLVQELFGGAASAPETEDGVTMMADAASGTGAGIEPGLVFFAGGLAVVVTYAAWWYLRQQDHLTDALPSV